MNKYPNHDYTNSQLLDCGIDKSVMLEQNYVDLMILHRSKGINSVDIIMSSNSGMSFKLFNATTIEFFGQ